MSDRNDVQIAMSDAHDADKSLDQIVASGDGGYQFHQHHRVPGAHLVARRQSSALPVGRRIGVGHLPSRSMAGRG